MAQFSVSGATGKWNKSTKTLTLSGPKNDVHVTVKADINTYYLEIACSIAESIVPASPVSFIDGAGTTGGKTTKDIKLKMKPGYKSLTKPSAPVGLEWGSGWSADTSRTYTLQLIHDGTKSGAQHWEHQHTFPITIYGTEWRHPVYYSTQGHPAEAQVRDTQGALVPTSGTTTLYVSSVSGSDSFIVEPSSPHTHVRETSDTTAGGGAISNGVGVTLSTGERGEDTVLFELTKNDFTLGSDPDQIVGSFGNLLDQPSLVNNDTKLYIHAHGVLDQYTVKYGGSQKPYVKLNYIVSSSESFSGSGDINDKHITWKDTNNGIIYIKFLTTDHNFPPQSMGQSDIYGGHAEFQNYTYNTSNVNSPYGILKLKINDNILHSQTIEFVVKSRAAYGISYTLDHVAIPSAPSTIALGKTVSMTVTPNAGYHIPDDVSNN